MNHKHKNSNLPMLVTETLRHGVAINTTTTISTWTELVQQFLSIFTAPTGDIFIRLTIGWILCTARRTVTGIIPFADPLSLRAHDA